jgi:hypothetical protein
MMDIQRNDDGSLDEIRASNCAVHIEDMGDGHWFVAIYPESDPAVYLDFLGCSGVHCHTVADVR